MRFLFGLIIGAFAGVVGTVTHMGPVDRPVVGLIIASLLVICGAWFVERAWSKAGWIGYFVAVAVTTMWLMFAPPQGDILISGNGWTSELWTVLALVCAVMPAVLAGFSRQGRVSSKKDETYDDRLNR